PSFSTAPTPPQINTLSYTTLFRSLDDQRADHQREQDGDEDRLRVLADDGLALACRRCGVDGDGLGLPDLGLADVHQVLSTVRKRSEEHTSELQSQSNLVCRLLLEK